MYSEGVSPIKTVVFIMGAGHCGSTLLDLILGSHPDAFSLAEFRKISILLEESDGGIPKNACVICRDHCEFWNARVSAQRVRSLYSRRNVLHRIRGKLARRLRNPYDPLFAATGKTILVDSSKIPGWFRRQLSPLSVWSDVRPHLIYLKRDGRAVVNSYLRKYPEQGLEGHTEHWMATVRKLDRFYAEFPFEGKSVVHYEDLARHPGPTVQQVCASLGVTYHREMLRYWRHDHHPIAGNGGTESLILKFRESQNQAPADPRVSAGDAETLYEKEYYDDVGLAIRLDERWKEELSPAQLEQFDRLAGSMNHERSPSTGQ